MVQLTQCLLHKHEDQDLISKTRAKQNKTAGPAICICKPMAGKEEAEGSVGLSG